MSSLLPRTAGARRPLVRAAAGAAALLLLAGCGSGFKAQTYLEKSTADSTNDAIGFMAVRNLAVTGPPVGTAWPAGANAPMTLTLVNEGAEADTLVQASSPAATSVAVTGPPLTVPGLGTSDPASTLTLQGLTRELPGGTYIELTMSFQRNGSKTMLVPVRIVPLQVERSEEEYHVGETDSEGQPLVEETEGAEQGGDNVIDPEGNPAGDNRQDPPISE